MSTFRIPTYEEFIAKNKELKGLFNSSGHLTEIQNLGNLQAASCTFEYRGRKTKKIAVITLVLDVFYNGMGVMSNPSSIRSWSGWGKMVSM